jgi:hypothetical protein
MSYSNGTPITYKFAAFAGISSIGQSSEKIAGPAGATGRLIALVAVMTTGNTTLAGLVELKNNASAVTYGRLVIPVLAVELVANAFVVDDVSDVPADIGRIPADAVLELDGDGVGTAGVADIYATILWDNT